MIEVNLLRGRPEKYFFSRHRVSMSAVLFVCAILSLALGHHLSVVHTPSSPEAAKVQTASSANGSTQG